VTPMQNFRSHHTEKGKGKKEILNTTQQNEVHLRLESASKPRPRVCH
jgi:hypothetical protein